MDKNYYEQFFLHREKIHYLHPLKYLFFELTDFCNLNCLHCGSSCSYEKATFLDKNIIEKVLLDVEEHYGNDSILICITGGEPLLHPQFFDIIKMIDDYGFRYGITSNGTLVDKEVVKKFKQYHLGSIAYSLDGLEREHNTLRQNPHSFLKAVEGIQYTLVGLPSIPIMVTSVIHKKNLSQLNDLYHFLGKINVKLWRVINIEPIGRANDQEELLLDRDDFITLFDFMKEHQENEYHMKITYGCSHYLPDEYDLKIRDFSFQCGAGTFVASICANGEIRACLDIERREDLIQGNVYKDTFSTIWENEFKLFREDKSLCEYCLNCERRIYCKGDSFHTYDFDLKKPKICLYNMLKKGEPNGY